VPAHQPRSSTTATVAHRRALGTQAFLGPADERPRAPAARRRAAFEQGRTPHPVLDRADSGPLAAFSSIHSIGTITRSVPPRSSRRNAPRGPNSSRSRNLRCAPIPRGAVQSCYAQGRRGGCAAPAAVSPGLCCGPRYAVIWHADAHQLTTPRGPRDEALRNSGTPTVGSERRAQVGGRRTDRASRIEY